MIEKELKELQKHRKIFYISPDMFLEYLRRYRNNNVVMLPKLNADVEGGIIHSFFTDPIRHAIGIIVLREDYPEVEEGQIAPSEYIGWEMRVFKVNHDKTNDILLEDLVGGEK